jgi:hypothetical protein
MSGEQDKATETGNWDGRWWGRFEVSLEGTCAWRIGPLQLYAQRWRQEWRLSWTYGSDPLDTTVGMDHGVAPPQSDDLRSARFAFRETDTALELRPRLADRSVVVWPETPLYVPGGEEAVLYVSTTLWVDVSAAEGNRHLIGLSAYRPSDSWFGPNPREGELCYASRSLARLRFEEVVQRPHRALSPITVRNLAADAFLIERLSVPVPQLPLYLAENGQFWTPPLVMERDEDGEQVALRFNEFALPPGLRADRIAEPRQRPDKNVLLKALDRLFG